MNKFCASVLAIFLSLNLHAQETREILNLPYSDATEDTLRQLNLVLPDINIADAPLLLWIGGGAWAKVDRHQEMNIAHRLAESGIAVASVGHRLSPALISEPIRKEGVEHPAHIQDIAQSFRWLYDHGTEYGYQTDQIFVGGFSSGAQLSALLALDQQYLSAQGLELGSIGGVIAVGGAYDLVHYRDFLVEANPDFLQNHIEAVFGKSEEALIAASPSTHLANLQAPMLIISDQNTYRYNPVFEDQLKAQDNTQFDVLHVGALSHADLWRHLAKPRSMYRDAVVGFILDHSGFDMN